MHFLLRRLRHSDHNHHQLQLRCLYDAAASVKCVRDRGLDHAVDRERNLKPVLNLKNLIKSEPSKSLPLSLISQSRDSLKIPIRPIEFIRKFPSIFEEFLPGGIGIQPHVKLTPEVLNYDKEEEIIYQSVNYRQDVANRLLKLLMIRRINSIPLSIIDGLRWELGLPQDYVKTVVPEFPDYFRVIDDANGEFLELVCWSNELAVSALEKGKEPIEFTFKYSNGFEMDKKYKKWVDEWRKLPYISPYENALHLAPKSDDSDKWAVAVLHEILNLFLGSKGERESVLSLGEWLGLRSRFKRALLQHPGIFYVSSKIGTHTVVLKEAYKRGMLIKKVPLMDMRYKYVQLMNLVKEDKRSKSVEQKKSRDLKGDQGEEALEDDKSGEEEDEEMHDLSDEESDDEYEERMNSKNRGNLSGKRYKEKKSPRIVWGRSPGRNSSQNAGKSKTKFHLRTEIQDCKSACGGSLERFNVPRRKNKSVSRERAST
ncbi:protein WHAT'S THIS FACTOR 9, mitochondrial-like [Coffea arabica]|uniref:Protein WHAT'S THIS FACTOR 9, mitochondrial-like n=1 Tax=Coffea arabica TaxID=13443 RepID=A0ABM4W1D5_COFAR|nr:protein WHAT'S THIS FACTOR 9, mitochondrial-like [Coffea arabica]